MTQAWFTDERVITSILTALAGLYLALRQAFPALPDFKIELVGTFVALLAGFGLFKRSTDETKPKLGLKTTRRM